ncbi:MAG: hypothetical protein QM796_10855 [Chthoniobacteraceae bacterium]
MENSSTQPTAPHGFTRTLREQLKFEVEEKAFRAQLLDYLDQSLDEYPSTNSEEREKTLVTLGCVGASQSETVARASGIVMLAQTLYERALNDNRLPDSVREGDGRPSVTSEEEAGCELVAIALQLSKWVRELSLKKPHLFSQLAPESIEWPLSVAKHPDWQKDNDELLTKLKVGSNTALPHLQRLSKRNTANQIYRGSLHLLSEHLVEIVEAAREYGHQNSHAVEEAKYVSVFTDEGVKTVENSPQDNGQTGAPISPVADVETHDGSTNKLLPPMEVIFADDPRIEVLNAYHMAMDLAPLSKDNVHDWFAVAWKWLLILTEDMPQDLELLDGVGGYQKHRHGKEDSNVRNAIKDRLKIAFEKRFGKLPS